MEESGQTKGKAPDMVEKILKGKVSKRLSEVCMTSQGHMAEEGSPVVEKHLKVQAGTLGVTKLALGGFRRWALGSN
jgi:translation elongation factor EF-Ts